MGKHAHIFLSYSRKDELRARALEQALGERGLRVWRDARSIAAGTRFFEAIEKGIRDARGVVVLVTPSSANSDWVTFEYAFATGARVPIVAVAPSDAEIPEPVLQHFQTVKYSTAGEAADRIVEGIQVQRRSARQALASTPKLFAKFQEEDGELCRAADGESICMDLWIDGAARETRSVTFEIMDLGVEDREWTQERPKRGKQSLRDFLTDDVSLYGDVDIWVRGTGRGPGNWRTKSTLYEALVRYHSDNPPNAQIRRGLKQIRER